MLELNPDQLLLLDLLISMVGAYLIGVYKVRRNRKEALIRFFSREHSIKEQMSFLEMLDSKGNGDYGDSLQRDILIGTPLEFAGIWVVLLSTILLVLWWVVRNIAGLITSTISIF